MTVAENNGGNIASNLLGLQPYNQHTQLGQNAGNVFSITQGTIEVVTGLTSAGGGGILTVVSSPLCVTVVGCAVPATTGTITAGGLVTATHGAAVVVNTLYNMGANQGPGSRSGGQGGSSGDAPSGGNTAKDYNPKGRSKIESADDAADQAEGVEKMIEKQKKSGGYVSSSKKSVDRHIQKEIEKYRNKQNKK